MGSEMCIRDRYMGWYDGNPSSLNNLPPAEVAPLYVSAMGGPEAVIALADDEFAAGHYRWVAELLKHVVFADPSNTAAKELLAKAYEQMGYQADPDPGAPSISKEPSSFGTGHRRSALEVRARTSCAPCRPKCCSISWRCA